MTDALAHPVFLLLDGAATAAVATDPDGVVRYANPRTAVVFGRPASGLVGRPLEELLPDGRLAGHVARRTASAAATDRQPDSRLELTARRGDGVEFPAEVILTPLPTDASPWLIVSVLDVSQRRDAELRVRRQSRRYLTLALINEAVAAADDVATLHPRICRAAVVQGGFVGARVVAHGPGGPGPVLASAGAPLTGTSAEAAAPSDGTEALFVDDLGPDASDVRSAAVLPLCSRGRTVATWRLYAERAGAFDESLRELLRGAADTISLALDRFESRAELDAALAQRTELLHRLAAAQEEERTRIADDVHDHSVQALAAVGLRLGMLRRRLAQAAPDLVADVDRLHDDVRAVGEGLRHLLFDLEAVPPSVTLTDLLSDAAAHVFELSAVDWRVENAPDPRELDLAPATRTHAVRVAKEALVNVAKHADARTATIRVTVTADDLEVRIADDGVGMAPGAEQPVPGHRGIAAMRDRVTLAGGELRLEPGHPGTVVTVRLPQP
ncbi:PAS domain-containing protein [Nocardioides anomalus]|uniref:histidine kinase n=1 Tax=Nocardioides anomalus TaxID=2712223 RepID=A0A6G6WG93_9ACTN|nr:ATP-binding protein [Nocardioides anomalus]QIG44070.1 PAS domain-containing protein [Nocardioides anomalus]